MKRFIKRNFKLLTLLLFLIIFASVGLTVALRLGFTPTSVGGTIGNIVVNVTYDKDTNDEYITSITSAGDLIPITIDTSNINNVINNDNVVKFRFGVSGETTNPNNSIYDISLVNINIDCELKNTNVKWVLYKNNILSANFSGNFSPTFDSLENNRMLLTPTQQNLTTTQDEYLLAIYIEDSNSANDDQSNFLGRSLSADIKIETATGSKKNNSRPTSTEVNCSANNTSINYPTCEKNQVYDGSAKNLITDGVVPSGVTVNQVTGVTPGDYTLTAKLNSGNKWEDGSTEDYTFTCSIEKRPVTIKTLDQVEGTFTSGPTYVSSTGLITGHAVHSINLSRITANDGADVISAGKAIIYDSNDNDVTNNYIINYQSLGKITPAS